MRRTAVRVASLAGVAVPIYFYVSDSRSSFYKHALKVGKTITENDAEYAHKVAVFLAKNSIAPIDRVGNNDMLAVKVWGHYFPNPIGLAAGFDKNAECMNSMLSGGLGFGFVEVGTITPLPQDGNPTPRVFRLSRDSAIINRYGFNSDGIDSVKKNLENFRTRERNGGASSRGLVGVNLGKNKDTVEAALDYALGARELAQYADYIVINVSSPNTAGLRSLQDKVQLHHLISAVQQELKSTVEGTEYSSNSSSSSSSFRPPLLIKISPDMTDLELADVAEVALQLKIDGIIISNTTIGQREGLLEDDLSQESGGLSGKPLLNLSNEALSKMYILTVGQIPLIGVGGVSCAADVYEKMKRGASLVQLYTALIYEGPGLPATLKEDLLHLMAADGFHCIYEVIGSAHKDITRKIDNENYIDEGS